MKPVLQALVLAEHIYEHINGQKIIAGTFTGFHFQKRKPPEEIDAGDGRVEAGGSGAPWAYISLTDVCDNTTLDLQFVSLDKNKILFETKLTIKEAQRLQTVELVVPLPRFQIPEAGAYAFEIVCDGEIVGSHRLIATFDEEGNEEKNEEEQ